MPLPLKLIELQQDVSPALQQARLGVGMKQGTQLSSRGTPLARLADRNLNAMQVVSQAAAPDLMC